MPEYKPSAYNLLLEGHEGEVGIFNTLTGALTVLDPEEWIRARSCLECHGRVVELDAITEGLVTQGHLVASDLDEHEIVRARKCAGISDANRLDVVVMPTLDCNFRCVYCYEEHRPSKMSPETVQALKRFLSREVPRHKGVMLHWYGGEPLLQAETMLDVTAYALRVADAAQVPITIQITTNGYELDSAMCRSLVDAGLREFQVTIDGVRAHHDALRPHRSGAGTYDRVLANVHTLLRTDAEVQVAVRVNFNHTNIDGVEGLFDQFPQDVRGRVRFVFEPIFGECDVRARSHIEDGVISERMQALHACASEKGYASSVSGVHAGKLVYCYAERESQVIVGPDGAVYKCGVSHFEEHDAAGRLREDGTVERFDRWADWTGEPVLEEECLACVYVPLCMGGCRKERAARGGGGDTCALVPQNVSSVLKAIALEGENGLAPLLGLGSSIEMGAEG